MSTITTVLLLCGPLLAQEPTAPKEDKTKQSAPLSEAIVGTWESVRMPVPNVVMVLELGQEKPGSLKWTIRSLGNILELQGTFEVINGKAVLFETERFLAGKKSFKQTVVIEGGMMTITDPDGTAAELKRVKPSKE